jgi:hypothetical protein
VLNYVHLLSKTNKLHATFSRMEKLMDLASYVVTMYQSCMITSFLIFPVSAERFVYPINEHTSDEMKTLFLMK